MAYAIVGNESLIIDMYPTAPKGAGAWPGDPAAWLASTNMPCAKARPVVGRVRLGASPLVWACFGSQAQPVDVRLSRDGHLHGSIGLREVAGWRACRVCPERLPVFFSKRQRRCTILCAMYCSASLCAGPALQPAVAPWRTFQFAGKLHALGRIRRSSGPAPRQVVVRGPHARTPVSLAYVYILASLARAPRRPWEFSAPRPGPRIPIFFNPRSTHARGLSRDTSCRRSCSGRALSILLARSFSP